MLFLFLSPFTRIVCKEVLMLISFGKRFRYLLFIFVFFFPTASIHATIPDDNEITKEEKKINGTSSIIADDWNVITNTNGTPRFIFTNNNKILKKRTANINMINSALTIIDSKKELFKIKNAHDEFRLKKQFIDSQGNQHLCFSQYAANLLIWGKEITFHFRSDGTLYSMNAMYVPTPVIQNSERIDSIQAISLAINSIGKASPSNITKSNLKKLLNYQGPKATKCIWTESSTSNAFVCWCVEIRPDLRETWVVFIDITSGNVHNKYNKNPFEGPVLAHAVDANDNTQLINVYGFDTSYCMIDASRSIWDPLQKNILNAPKGAIWTVRYDSLSSESLFYSNLFSKGNKWTDKISVSAHHNAGLTYNYYYNTFKRKSINDSGCTIMSIVHLTDYNGEPYDNAFWNDPFVAFGDGKYYRPLAAALDVVAHELTHGVIQHTVNLDYQFQSGALNESLADIFAVMVDRNNWLIGEQIGRSGPIRNMENPQLCGQPSHMKDFVQCSILQDNGGVHVNSGIPNNACVRIANFIGKAKTEQIFYRVLSANYLNQQSEFIDFRFASLQATKDLYGIGNEYHVVENAFDSVGITQSMTKIIARNETKNDLASFHTIQTKGNLTLEYTINNSAEVSLTLFDFQGRKVQSIPPMKQNSGTYRVPFSNGSEGNKHIASGLYFCKISLSSNSEKQSSIIKCNLSR